MEEARIQTSGTRGGSFSPLFSCPEEVPRISLILLRMEYLAGAHEDRVVINVCDGLKVTSVDH